MIVVTGGLGFIGRHLTHHLLEQGRAVRILTRGLPVAGAAAVVSVGPEPDAATLRGALEGADAVVHLAARVHVMDEVSGDPLGEFRRANVDLTRHLIRAASEVGVRRLLFASSVKAMGETTTSPWTEESDIRPVDPYGISKREAEEVVLDGSARGGPEGVVVRLPAVFGPGMGGNLLRLFETIRRGVPLPLGAIHNRRTLLFVRNLADLLARLIDAPGAGGETFMAGEPRAVSTPELVRLIAAALGRRPRLLPVPVSLFRMAGRIGDAVGRWVPAPVSSSVVDRLTGNLEVDSTKLMRRLGYPRQYSLEEGIQQTADWFLGRRREASA